MIRKEGALPDSEDAEKTAEAKPKEKYICPDCKIIYEKTKSCIRCGAGVIPLSSFQPKERDKTVEESEAEKDSSQVLTTQEWLESSPEPLICPACKKEHLGGKSCIRCGTALVPPGPPPKEEKTKKPSPPVTKTSKPKPVPTPELEADLSEEDTPDLETHKMSVQEQIKKGRFVRKIKKDYPRMVLNWSGIAIILVAIGYFFWSTYSHIVIKSPALTIPPPSKEKPSSPVSTFLPIPPSGGSATEAEEVEKIRNLLENIRKANLAKDSDLFISSYSRDFKDREGKKRATVESWENFNFLDLTFDLGSTSISGNSARARVTWLVRFSPKGGGQPQESKTILDVVFKKEDGDWKIGEIE
ncbi:MAG: nuclear transport factor 2 family protein [Deltaproteobacteria bacterium]|nr:nuclear transport factor 2 family protein [Deltaproteobacteria bacterium]